MSTDGSDGRYYAKGREIWKASRKRQTDNGVTLSIGFQVCTVTEWVNPDDVARALNIAEYGE